jgi:uncharacterized protein
MNPVSLLEKYFPDRTSFAIVCEHSRLVAAKASAIARNLSEPVDVCFVEEAAWLHDIGICRTAAPKIGCFGNDSYMRHGIHGRRILETEGLHRHAMVCERHIGVGITAEDVKKQRLPLPVRNMSPTCIEEEIITFADLFFSKKPASISIEKSVISVRENLLNHGSEKLVIFDRWLARFGNPLLQVS